MLSKDFFYAIRFRLMASVFALLAISISATMYGLWHFERNRYMLISKEEVHKAGRAIEKALRASMIEKNPEVIRQAVDEIRAVVKPSVISILSLQGKVAISSETNMQGRYFNRNNDASCTACHTGDGLTPEKDSVFLDTEHGPVLRTVIKVPNGPECYACHPPSQKNCGILLYDVFFADTLASIRTMLVRMLLTGLASFAMLFLIMSFIIQRYVHRPVRQLMEGFIHVGRGDFNYWVDVDTKGEFLEMADQFNVMSHAIQRSFAELKGKNWETTSLYTFVQQLSRAIEWNRLRRMITDLLYSTFNAKCAVIWLLRERHHDQTVSYEVSWRLDGDLRYYHRDYGIEDGMEAVPCGLPSEWRQWQAGELTAANFTENDTRAFLPLISKEVSLGAVCLQRNTGQPFTASEKKLILAVGEQVGIALANARLYRMAITDGLTGLYTRRYCETAMRKLMDAHAAAPGEGFCVLMLDIDHFKRVNDTYGHQVGDEVLIQLADLIQASIRQEDVACRFGGEEFILLISGDLNAGREAGSRLRRIIEEHPFSNSVTEPLRNTISIGVANYPLHGKTGDEIIGAADQALYLAKEQGRNRVVCAEGPAVV